MGKIENYVDNIVVPERFVKALGIYERLYIDKVGYAYVMNKRRLSEGIKCGWIDREYMSNMHILEKGVGHEKYIHKVPV